MADSHDAVPARAGSAAGLVWLLAGVVLLAVATLYVLNALDARDPWVNHDVGYHTYLGKEMARGERLYIDLKEDNPPGSPLLLGALAVLGAALGLPQFVVPHLFVLCLGLVGLGVLRYALREEVSDTVWALTALAYLVVIVRGGFSNSLYADGASLPYDFGQREHLFSLLFVPYLFMRLRRRHAPGWFLVFVVLLGYVATFKPFWAPMILLVEWVVRVQRGRWGRVPAAVAVGVVLPVLLLGLHSTDSLMQFLTENIPMYLRGGYDFYETGFAQFARTGLHLQMLVGAALLVAGGLLARSVPAAQRGLFAALAGAAYFAVWHQHKFWSYHTMPFFALTIVPASYLLASAATRQGSRRGARRLIGIGAAAWLLLSAWTVVDTARMLNRYPPLGAFLRPVVEPYERVMYFSMSVMVQYPPLVLEREMVGPWTVFLDLPELLGIPDPQERERRVRSYFAEVRETVERERPELLAFSPYGQALPPDTTLHQLAQQYAVIPDDSYRRITAGALGSADPQAARWIFYRRVDLRSGLP